MKNLNFSLLSMSAAALFAMSVETTQAQCPGVLLVNEISNGKSGQQEFIELIAGSSSEAACASSDSVDISGWIIDDNNGYLSDTISGAFPDYGISQGHWRLTDDEIWTKFPKGDYLVLFNAADYNTSIAAFNAAALDPNGIHQTDTATYVAVGFTLAIEKNSSVPAADSLGGDTTYCGSGSYGIANTWATASLRNNCDGDGIQTRCPGCKISLGEPAAYHAISYGERTAFKSNSTFLDAAHLDFAMGDTVCGTGRTFYLSAGTNALAPELSGNWAYAADSTNATPGAPNTAANADFRDSLVAGVHTYDRCPAPATSEVPKGVLIVTEISNGPSGSCEYAEIIVAACEDDQFAQYVDIRGWILDDNAGNFNRFRTCGSGHGITSGHLRLAYNDVWDSVLVGSIIVVYNYSDNCYDLDTNYTGPDGNNVYWQPVGGTNPNIESVGSYPSSSNCDYCAPGGNNYSAPASSWTGRVGLRNSSDAFQVRCPGCTDEITGEPAFYHGVGYGSLTDFLSISAGSNDLGGPVLNYSSSTGKKYVFEGTSVAATGNPADWTRYNADTAGAVPPTLGNVESTFQDGIDFGFFSFPCCDASAQARNKGLNKSSLGAADAAADERLLIYPNPSNGQFFIELSSEETANVRILDNNGRLVLDQRVNGQTKNQIDLSGNTAGIYFYQVTFNNEVKTGKIVIK
jgi:hypothetical protein